MAFRPSFYESFLPDLGSTRGGWWESRGNVWSDRYSWWGRWWESIVRNPEDDVVHPRGPVGPDGPVSLYGPLDVEVRNRRRHGGRVQGSVHLVRRRRHDASGGPSRKEGYSPRGTSEVEELFGGGRTVGVVRPIQQ